MVNGIAVSLLPKKTQKTWLLLVITFDDGECARHRVCGESDLPLFPACQSLDQMMTKQHFSYRDVVNISANKCFTPCLLLLLPTIDVVMDDKKKY